MFFVPYLIGNLMGLFSLKKQLQLVLPLLMLYNFGYSPIWKKMKNFIWQQDGAPLHWHNNVRNWLNIPVPNPRISHKGFNDIACFAMASTFTDFMLCDFYIWGFIKDRVYVPSLPTNLPNLRNRIEEANQCLGRTGLSN